MAIDTVRESNVSAKLIKRACLVLKPHPGGVAVKCANVGLERCAPEDCVWARRHKLPADSPLRRVRTLTAKATRR